ncbi:uncharacterized protein DS421_6g173430 [Arachis hypogaea]|nr:uncharacterized protein DS421_6g173430 [Arachis hypogaea]
MPHIQRGSSWVTHYCYYCYALCQSHAKSLTSYLHFNFSSISSLFLLFFYYKNLDKLDNIILLKSGNFFFVGDSLSGYI